MLFHVSVNARCMDLSVLRNDLLPVHVLLTTYNRQGYQNAILHPLGLHNPEQCSLFRNHYVSRAGPGLPAGLCELSHTFGKTHFSLRLLLLLFVTFFTL